MVKDRQIFRHNRNRLPAALVFVAGLFVALHSLPADTGESLDDILELRGYTRIGGVLQFSVFNKEKQRSEWLEIDEENHGYRIESYDPDKNEIVIRYRGLTTSLPLQASQIANYVAPAPQEKPEDRQPEPRERQGGQRARHADADIALNGSHTLRNFSLEQDSGRGENSGSNTRAPQPSGGFLPGVPSIPSIPNSPSSPPTPKDKPDGDSDHPELPSWDSLGSPPPLPSKPAPSYSPES